MSERRIEIVLGAKDRTKLKRIVADGNTPQKIVKRAKIVVLSAEGHGVTAIMREVEVSKTTVWRWQDYFVEAGVVGLLKGRSKPPGKKPICAEIKLKLVEKTVKERPANATHWSVRMMAEEMGISHTSVQRIWHEHGLKPHLVRSFKVSNDPDFAKKVEDIVGLYLDPPERALVLSIDEKSQIQALDRTQPGLPMKKGRAGTMTHDYKRNGTTTLFAEITRQRIRRGTFTCVPELIAAIEDWIAHRNTNPKPFTWTKTAKKLIASHRRARKALDNQADGCT